MRAWSSRRNKRCHEQKAKACGIYDGLKAQETPGMNEFKEYDRLYLDDLRIGQRFTSGTYMVDEEQIKAFARQFDPQPFHLDNEAA
jgi:hypothetical protein